MGATSGTWNTQNVQDTPGPIVQESSKGPRVNNPKLIVTVTIKMFQNVPNTETFFGGQGRGGGRPNIPPRAADKSRRRTKPIDSWQHNGIHRSGGGVATAHPCRWAWPRPHEEQKKGNHLPGSWTSLEMIPKSSSDTIFRSRYELRERAA